MRSVGVFFPPYILLHPFSSFRPCKRTSENKQNKQINSSLWFTPWLLFTEKHNQILNHMIINTPPGDGDGMNVDVVKNKRGKIKRFEYLSLFGETTKLHSWCFTSFFIIWKIFSCFWMSSSLGAQWEKGQLDSIEAFTLYSFLLANKFFSVSIDDNFL